MIKEFPDVFLEELPSIPPKREVDLAIGVLHGTTPISRAPYSYDSNLTKRVEDSTSGAIGQGIRPT